MMVTMHDLLSVLRGHLGREQGVTAEYLADALSIEKRHVRSLVTELRLEGVAVCGTPRDGYYIAQTGEELEATCAFLRSRAMHSLTLESRLRKVALGELLGQLRVPS